MSIPQKLALRIQELESENAAKDREIEVLTAERDNALLRIEEMETELLDCQAIADGNYRGGVNPNA